jgi:excisionase family DNA binding protein
VECNQVKDKLVEFMDNEVSDEMREVIQAHLDSCADCSEELESLRKVKDLCRNWENISPSRDWGIELRRKLAKAQGQSTPELEVLRSAVVGLSRRVRELEESRAILPPTLDSDIMTIDELARYLRLSTDQVYDIIDQLPRFQIGYEYRFKRESIDQWIRALEQRPYPQNYLWGDWYTGEE